MARGGLGAATSASSSLLRAVCARASAQFKVPAATSAIITNSASQSSRRGACPPAPPSARPAPPRRWPYDGTTLTRGWAFWGVAVQAAWASTRTRAPVRPARPAQRAAPPRPTRCACRQRVLEARLRAAAHFAGPRGRVWCPVGRCALLMRRGVGAGSGSEVSDERKSCIWRQRGDYAGGAAWICPRVGSALSRALLNPPIPWEPARGAPES